MRGRVKWWSDRGYGFLTGDDSRDYFVHYTDVVCEGRKDLKRDAVVEFVATKNARGPKAVQVRAAADDGHGGMNESPQDAKDGNPEAGSS